MLEDAWIPVTRDVHAAQPQNCDATHREAEYHDGDEEQRVEIDALPLEVCVEDQARVALSLRARRTAWERARVANLCAVGPRQDRTRIRALNRCGRDVPQVIRVMDDRIAGVQSERMTT